MKERIMLCDESRVSDIPTYVQDLVRCKDCKYGAPTIINGVWLSVKCGGLNHRPDWFCADGKRTTE